MRESKQSLFKVDHPVIFASRALIPLLCMVLWCWKHAVPLGIRQLVLGPFSQHIPLLYGMHFNSYISFSFSFWCRLCCCVNWSKCSVDLSQLRLCPFPYLNAASPSEGGSCSFFQLSKILLLVSKIRRRGQWTSDKSFDKQNCFLPHLLLEYALLSQTNFLWF